MNYISPTRIGMYLRCGAQYKYKYVDKIALPPSASQTRGKAVHSGQEYNYRQKLETFEDLKLFEVQEYTAAEFDGLALDTEFTSDEKPGEILDETISLATLYHQEVAPTVQPVEVEKELRVDVGGIELLGYADLIDSEGFIRDTKTAKRTPPKNATESLQLSAYCLAYRLLTGTQEAGVKLDYLVQNKKPKVVTMTAARTMQDLDRFMYVLNGVVDGIEKEVFIPNPANMLCSPKYCGYWLKCHHEYGGM